MSNSSVEDKVNNLFQSAYDDYTSTIAKLYPVSGFDWVRTVNPYSESGYRYALVTKAKSFGGMIDRNHDGIDDRLQKHRRRRRWWERALWLPWKKYA